MFDVRGTPPNTDAQLLPEDDVDVTDDAGRLPTFLTLSIMFLSLFLESSAILVMASKINLLPGFLRHSTRNSSTAVQADFR